jgi:hypothetical protein
MEQDADGFAVKPSRWCDAVGLNVAVKQGQRAF